jgi:hypothetical protein
LGTWEMDQQSMINVVRLIYGGRVQNINVTGSVRAQFDLRTAGVTWTYDNHVVRFEFPNNRPRRSAIEGVWRHSGSRAGRYGDVNSDAARQVCLQFTSGGIQATAQICREGTCQLMPPQPMAGMADGILDYQCSADQFRYALNMGPLGTVDWTFHRVSR